MEIRILDSKGEVYLKDVLKANNMNDLPDNVMLNKITTGCGMTTAAIISSVPYVIAVPQQRLIENKLEWCERNGIDMLGVYDYGETGIGVEEIREFKGNKIMVTYDSLYKVTKALEENGRISDFKIMIDESHEIIKSGNYRYGAIDSVLNEYIKYKSFIFGTATPVEDKYQHPKLKGIQKMQVKWYDLEPVTVNYCVYYKDLLKAAAVQVVKHLTGEMKCNGHFFINSVTDIVAIMKHVIKGGNNYPDKIRIITANNNVNEAKIIGSLGKGYQIGDVNSESNIVNFYTSTCFNGVDFYDENGLTYIISDGSKHHTKIDIITQLPQIIGRLRNTKYSNFVNLIYSPNKYFSHATEEEFEIYTKMKIEEAKKYIDLYNMQNVPMIKENMLKGAQDNVYIRILEDTEELILNDTALYSEMQNFKTLHTTYYHTKKEKLEKKQVEKQEAITNEITYLYTPMDAIKIKGLNKYQIAKSANFIDMCKEYQIANTETKKQIAMVHPIISKAYKELGYEAIKALKFEKSQIEKKLLIEDKLKSLEWKIANLLDLKNGEWISRKDLKDKFKNVYEELKINKIPTAEEISKYYEVREKSKKIDKTLTRGFIIVRNNFNKTNQ